ncbi:MAG TPA: prepilin-type N-terminal cleavage/methylation domain-containing protein [Cellulomonas sp.]
MRDLVRRTKRASDSGFGLVEVMVACLVLGIMSAAIVAVIMQAQSASVTNRSRIAAANLAARELDMVRDEFHRTKTAPTDIAQLGTVVDAHPLDGGTAGQPLVVDGTPYTVTRSVQWNITGNGQSACDGGSLVIYPTLGVTVSVTWPRMGTVHPVVSTAQLAPDKGSGIPNTDSFIAVRVKDSTGAPSVGRSIKVTGGSQTKTGSTDADGCAVLEVAPAVGVGTSYTAQVTDSGYVDISSTPQPSKAVGYVSQGQLNNSVSFTVAQPGSATIHLVDSSGAAVPAAQANGVKVTVVASEYSGASPAKTYTLTGPTLSLTNLWPTQYGAYYGTIAPPSGYDSKRLAPGGSIDLNAVLQLATTSIDGLPSGTTAVIAAPAGSTTCTVTGAVAVPNPAAISLLPGNWGFFAVGQGNPAFACSPGPGTGTQSPITLGPGPNDGVTWGTTTLQLAGTVPAGTRYALDTAKAGNLGSACPNTSLDASAITLGTGASTIPAGTWYVYARNGATCSVPIAGATNSYPFAVAYGGPNTLTWPNHAVTLNISNIGAIVRSNSINYWPSVYLSPVPVTDSSVVCSRTGLTIGGTTQVPLALSGTNNTNGTKATTSGTVYNGTWYLIANDQNSSKPTWPTRNGGKTCGPAGSIVIVATTTSPQSLAYSVTVP